MKKQMYQSVSSYFDIKKRKIMQTMQEQHGEDDLFEEQEMEHLEEENTEIEEVEYNVDEYYNG